MNTRTILGLLSLIMMILCLPSCNSTSTEKGSLSGMISLDGETDHSGITVMIFNEGIFPLELVDNQDVLGENLASMHVFDHREFNPVRVVQTNTSGAFSCTDLNYGDYIVAYFKEGWGFQYLFNVNLDAHAFDIGNNILYEEISVPSSISGTYTFDRGKTYRITSISTSLPGSNIILSGDCNIIIDPQTSFIVNGDVTIHVNEGEIARITASSSIYSAASNILPAGYVEFSSFIDGLTLYGLHVSHLYEGVKILSDQAEISQCFFTHNDQALQVNGVDNVTISHCVFMNNQNMDVEAIYAYNTNAIHIVDNIFYQNGNTIKTEIGKNSLISGNLFLEGENEIQTLWESTAVVQYNTFRRSIRAIGNSGKSNLEIYYNDISADVCIRTFRTTDWINNPSIGWTKSNYNNLNGAQFAVYSGAPYHNNGQPMPLDFSNNYWGSTSPNEIASMIFDHNDGPTDTLPPNANWAIINYIPFKSNPIANAGIPQRARNFNSMMRGSSLF